MLLYELVLVELKLSGAVLGGRGRRDCCMMFWHKNDSSILFCVCRECPTCRLYSFLPLFYVCYMVDSCFFVLLGGVHTYQVIR